jgi:hypothetical protein
VEGTWSDDNLASVKDLIEGLSVDTAAAYLGLNALGVYDFDRAYIATVASRIGPSRLTLVGSATSGS